MAHSEYDLQALIYTLALHRWLRFRLGDAYDYARDFGGVRYVFCRGLDATREDAQGVQAWRFDPGLVDALDALFAGEESLSLRERRSEEHTSELQSLMRSSYAVFCLKKTKNTNVHQMKDA